MASCTSTAADSWGGRGVPLNHSMNSPSFGLISFNTDGILDTVCLVMDNLTVCRRRRCLPRGCIYCVVTSYYVLCNIIKHVMFYTVLLPLLLCVHKKYKKKHKQKGKRRRKREKRFFWFFKKCAFPLFYPTSTRAVTFQIIFVARQSPNNHIN